MLSFARQAEGGRCSPTSACDGGGCGALEDRDFADDRLRAAAGGSSLAIVLANKSAKSASQSGVPANERDRPAVAVNRLWVLASGLMDHAETIVAVVHLWKPHQKVAGGLLGLVELANAAGLASCKRSADRGAVRNPAISHALRRLRPSSRRRSASHLS